jgi:hypothetical protein
MYDLRQQQPTQLHQANPQGAADLSAHQRRRSAASKHCPYLKAVFRVTPDDVCWGPDEFRDDHAIVGDII